MVDRPNTTPIGQDREILTFKALLYLNVAVHAQVCRLFCVVYILLFSLVQLGYPAITNIFAVNQIIRYNEDPLKRTFFFGTMALRYIAGCHCSCIHYLGLDVCFDECSYHDSLQAHLTIKHACRESWQLYSSKQTSSPR